MSLCCFKELNMFCSGCPASGFCCSRPNDCPTHCCSTPGPRKAWKRNLQPHQRQRHHLSTGLHGPPAQCLLQLRLPEEGVQIKPDSWTFKALGDKAEYWQILKHLLCFQIVQQVVNLQPNVTKNSGLCDSDRATLRLTTDGDKTNLTFVFTLVSHSFFHNWSSYIFIFL